MSGVFPGLVRFRRVLAHVGREMIQQRARFISGKPPKDNIGAKESAFVMTVMALAVLGPSGWILSHLDEYKSRG